MLNSRLRQSVTRSVVNLPEGQLLGLCKDGGYLFRGVRYAQAQRFRTAEPIAAWKGSKEAVVYGYTGTELETVVRNDQFQAQHFYWPQSEHCQFLNIWTQHLDPSAARPVIVWWHGGGWGSGSSVEQFCYDGEEMSRYGDIVFVSVEYRLNVFGALDLSEYGESYRESCWASLSDAVAALKWIHGHIAHFGGDPDNVMLIGHAGGGPQVLALLNTPAAQGLFHKAAMGGNVTGRKRIPAGWTEKDVDLEAAERVVRELGLTRETIASIDSMPAGRILAAARKVREEMSGLIGGKFAFEPRMDGEHLRPYSLEDPIPEWAVQIPLLFGGDLGDASSNFRKPLGDNLKDRWSEETIRAYLKEMYGSAAQELLALFRQAYPDHNPADLLFLDRKARYKCLRIARKQAQQGGRVWNWIYARNLAVDGGTVPWHCCDTPLITHTAQYYESTYCPGMTEYLQDSLCGAYCHFAWTGDPGTDELPIWPSVTQAHVPTMVFDDVIELKTDYDAELQEKMKPWQV